MTNKYEGTHAYAAGRLLAQVENYFLENDLKHLPSFPVIMVHFVAMKEMLGKDICRICSKCEPTHTPLGWAWYNFNVSSKEEREARGEKYIAGTSRDFAVGYGQCALPKSRRPSQKLLMDMLNSFVD